MNKKIKQGLLFGWLMATVLIAVYALVPLIPTVSAQSNQTVTIEIKDFKFTPDTVTVPVGAKVIWTNKDSVSHTVTSDVAGTFGSELLKQNSTFEVTFTKAGTFDFHCEPHPFMKGKIVVQAAAAPATTAAPVTTAAVATTTVASAATTAPAANTTTVAATTAAVVTTVAAVKTTAAVAAPVATTAPATVASTPATTSSNDNGQLPFLIVGVVLVLAAIGGGFYLFQTRRTK